MTERLGPVIEQKPPLVRREVDKAFWAIVAHSLADIHNRSASTYMKG